MGQNNSIRFFNKVNEFESFFQLDGSDRYREYAKQTYNKGKYIYLSGDTADKVYFIHRGAVKMAGYTDVGNELITGILHSGDIFGELAVYGETHRADYAQAIEETEVYELDIEEVIHLMEKVKDFVIFLNQAMAKRIIQSQKRLESLLYKDVKTRIAEYILEQAGKNGKVLLDGAVFLPNHLTHQEIATFVGTSRQTVTTTLNRFRAARLLDFDRKRITIRNLEALKQEGKRCVA